MASFIFPEYLQAVSTQCGKDDSVDKATCTFLILEFPIPEECFLKSMKDSKNLDLKS